MADLAAIALRESLRALAERNRQIAYSVILRDQHIDELEKEIDRLCLEFIVRQQPVAGSLRFAYGTIKINLELERVGDYAESMARQILVLADLDVEIPHDRVAEIASLAIPMLLHAVQAFVTEDSDLARKTIDVEDQVDLLRHRFSVDLLRMREEGRIPLEALMPLMTIVNRFERVSDQAKSICQEVLYICTGEYAKHQGNDVFRLLFVDEHDACRSQMAAGIGNGLGQPKFIFSSAGLDPRPVDARTVAFLGEKGIDISREVSKSVAQVPHLAQYQIIVALAKAADQIFPPAPTKVVCLDWSVRDPSEATGAPADVNAAYEDTYQFLHAHIRDLVEAILGDNDNSEKGRHR
jgi:phosphate transport system protein